MVSPLSLLIQIFTFYFSQNFRLIYGSNPSGLWFLFGFLISSLYFACFFRHVTLFATAQIRWRCRLRWPLLNVSLSSLTNSFQVSYYVLSLWFFVLFTFGSFSRTRIFTFLLFRKLFFGQLKCTQTKMYLMTQKICSSGFMVKISILSSYSHHTQYLC